MDVCKQVANKTNIYIYLHQQQDITYQVLTSIYKKQSCFDSRLVETNFKAVCY